MACDAWTKTSLFALSFDTIQLHIEQKVFLQHSFIFGHMAMKHPVYARIRGLQLSLLDILKTAGKVTHYCDIFNLVHRTLHKVVCHRRRICLCKYAWLSAVLWEICVVLETLSAWAVR